MTLSLTIFWGDFRGRKQSRLLLIREFQPVALNIKEMAHTLNSDAPSLNRQPELHACIRVWTPLTT